MRHLPRASGTLKLSHSPFTRTLPAIITVAIVAWCGTAVGQAPSGNAKADKPDAKAGAAKAESPEARALAAPDDPTKLPKPTATERKDDPFADETPAKASDKGGAKPDDPFATTPSKGKLDDKKPDNKKADDKGNFDPFAEPTATPKKTTDIKTPTDPFSLPSTTDSKKTDKAVPDTLPGFDDLSKPAKPGDDSKPADDKSTSKSRPLTDTLSDTKTTEPPASPGQAELKKGQDLLDAGKFNEAIEPLKQAIKLAAAGEAGPHYTLGVVYRMLSRYDDAIEEFTEALKNDPALTDALLRRGVCWYYKDEYSLAQADFDDASGASTTDPRPLTWKGMTLVKLGQLRDAINVYSEALRYDNHYAPAHINRGLAYVALKEYGRAVTDFDQAIRSTPKDASLYYKRGIAQGGLGNWQGAVKSYSEAIRINPKFADAYSGRSAAYRRLGDAEKAQADATKLQELKTSTGRVGQSAAR